MFRALWMTSEGKIHTSQSVMDVAFALQDPTCLLWVDFESTPAEEDEPILRKTFNFHPLAIDDALQETHVPKVDDWGQYLYIVLHAIVINNHEEVDLDTLELDVFMGKNYIVTHHDDPIEAVTRLWDTLQRDERHLKHGPDHLLYRLTDELISSYMPVVEMLDDQIDQAEIEIFDRPVPGTLEHIFSLKRSILHMRRIIGPQREVLSKLARDEYAVIDPQERVYFRDVYDHLVRLYDITESIRDLISGTLDTYLSVINNRMNEVMKTLTIITTLFMPLSFVAGFFGMNFFLPEQPITSWMSRPVFWLVLALMIILPLLMFRWIRQRGWM
ncbi:MAG: magnesium/cobalt transporter CorA [Anaerolineales bacterium]|nr:magnesium/cobalt transporter CorA [Anaerolineales bacterium]